MVEKAPGEEPDGSSDSDGKDSSVECPTCGKGYANLSCLRYHYKTDTNDCSGVKCPTCENDHFTTREGMKRHHYSTHGESLAGVLYECNWCGEETRKNRSIAERLDNVYCDQDCYGAHQEEAMSGEGNPMWEGRTKEIECTNCGDTYTESKVRIERSENNYCSFECRVSDGRVTTECVTCGTEFTKKKSKYERSDKDYCSRECRDLRVELTCANCGKEYKRSPANVRGEYCSTACFFKSNGETQPERCMRLFLDQLEIEYEQEWPVPGTLFVADFYLPNRATVIEVDGEYWHSDAEVKEKDARKDITCGLLGLNMIRITASEAKDLHKTNISDPEEVVYF